MFLVLAVLVAVYLLWILWKPDWLPKAPNNKLNTTITENAQAVTAQSVSWWKRLSFVLPGPRATRASNFKEWAMQTNLADHTPLYGALAAEATAFSAWLNTLSPSALENYVNNVADFCYTMKCDLNWLVNRQEAADPRLRRSVEALVILYCLTTWKMQEVQGMLRYTDWKTAPNRNANRLFVQQLYDRVVAAGLAERATDLMAPDAELQQATLVALEKVATEQPEQFAKWVKETFIALATPKPAPEPTPAAVPLDATPVAAVH